MAKEIVVKEIVVKPLSQAKHWAIKALGFAMIGCIKVYQYTISPLLGPRCRFWPSCSSFTVEAIQVHGPFKGGWMAIKRILRCHPGSAGGIDPVPGGRSEQLCREDPDLTAPPHSECNHKCDHQH